jgi:predicted signal transduction protein with EAL and GGDEF domain
VIGRVGGDKFGAILSNVPESELDAATDKILETNRSTPIETPEGPVYVTVSIGAVTFPNALNKAQDVMMRADVALQKAKRLGRDCAATYTFSEEQQEHHKACLVIADQVQRALRERRLRFAYQPIVDARSREPKLHECLLRIVEPDGSIVVAGQFMPVVEDIGMIRNVDRSVLERAVEELSMYPDAKMAVNVSGLTTTDRSWMRSATAMLRGRPDLAERMVIEITETAGLEDLEECCRFVSTLRDMGCEVALDDFGAGYTSFRHLKQLAVNKIKIDGSFVRKIGENPDNLVFIRTLIDLARTFDLETVAECVETEVEAELLLNEGVHYLQGYAFGKPDLEAPWKQASHVSATESLGFGQNLSQDSGETETPDLLPFPATG